MRKILLFTLAMLLIPLTSWAASDRVHGFFNLRATTYALTEATGACALPVGLSNIYTLTPTDNQDTTITFSGAGTAGDIIIIVFTTGGTGDEVITFHTTLVNSAGTLTLGTTASRFYTITLISNGTVWFEIARTGEQS